MEVMKQRGSVQEGRHADRIKDAGSDEEFDDSGFEDSDDDVDESSRTSSPIRVRNISGLLPPAGAARSVSDTAALIAPTTGVGRRSRRNIFGKRNKEKREAKDKDGGEGGGAGGGGSGSGLRTASPGRRPSIDECPSGEGDDVLGPSGEKRSGGKRGIFSRRRNSTAVVGRGELPKENIRSKTTDDLYPAPLPFHRPRAEYSPSGPGPLSEDPDFYPPVPLMRRTGSDGSSGGEQHQSRTHSEGRGSIRGGRFPSPFGGGHNSNSNGSGAGAGGGGHADEDGKSGTTTYGGGGGGICGTDIETDVVTNPRAMVRYGDTIRVWAYSNYTHKGGYIGCMRRVTKRKHAVGKGELFVIPPTPPSHFRVFHEACFKIVDPEALMEDGEVVHFGDVISLVDDRGMVWNNKDGRLHGRLGPALFGNGGHMLLTLCKDVASQGGGGDINGNGVASPTAGERKTPLLYGDDCKMMAKKIRPHRKGVARAYVTHFRRARKVNQNLGGYLRSDGKGKPVTFNIHHAPPRVTMVSVYAIASDGTVVDTHTHYKVPWKQELEFTMPPPDPVVTPPTASSNHTSHSGSGGSGPGSPSPPPPPQSTPKTGGGGGGGRKHLGGGGGGAGSGVGGGATTAAVTPVGTPVLDRSMNGDSGQVGDDDDDDDDVDEGPKESAAAIRIAFSTGGEVVLRRTELLSCQHRARWFDAADGEQPVCLLAQCRSLKGKEKTKKDKAEEMEGKIVLMGLCFLFACAVQVLRVLPLGGGILSVLTEMVLHALLLLGALHYLHSIEILAPPENNTLGDRYAIKLLKCEQGYAIDKPVEAGEEEDVSLIPPLPDTFRIAEAGNEDKAMERWKATLDWREEVGADRVLKEPHSMFCVIKQFYPTAFYGRDKNGAVVYYEQLGRIKIEEMKSRHISPDDILRHYMYQMEYLWTIINPNDEDRITIVLDMKGVTVGDFSGETKAFVIKAIGMMTTHYPARSECIFIVNVPRWFNIIFQVVKTCLNDTQKRKIRPCTEKTYRQELLERIDDDNLPPEYGGKGKLSMFQSEWETNMTNMAKKVAQEHNIDMVPV